MAKTKLTEAEREQRRAEDRRRIEEAVRELRTSQGWQRWVAVRRHNGLGRYSFNNQLLIAIACRRRGIEPTFGAGYRWWSEHGYQVRKGEKAIRIRGPVRRWIEDDETREPHLAVVGFTGVPVFDTLSRARRQRAERRRRAFEETGGVGPPERPGGSRRRPDGAPLAPLRERGQGPSAGPAPRWRHAFAVPAGGNIRTKGHAKRG